jgi:hypothetical protein
LISLTDGIFSNKNALFTEITSFSSNGACNERATSLLSVSAMLS